MPKGISFRLVNLTVPELPEQTTFVTHVVFSLFDFPLNPQRLEHCVNGIGVEACLELANSSPGIVGMSRTLAIGNRMRLGQSQKLLAMIQLSSPPG